VGDTMDFEQLKVDEQKAQDSEIEVEERESSWWKKRKSIDVFENCNLEEYKSKRFEECNVKENIKFEENNVEESKEFEENIAGESKRQRKKRKTCLPSLNVENLHAEKVSEDIAENENDEENTDASPKESTEEITGESTEKKSEENAVKRENTEDDVEESETPPEKKVLDTRKATIAEILMLRKKLSQKPIKKAFSQKQATCKIEEKVGKDKSDAISITMEQDTLNDTLDNITDFNVAEDEKMATDNIAEILPTVHIKTRMVELYDEIDADGEVMTKLDLFENDINDEEELRRSLELEELEELEEVPLEKETLEKK